LTTASSSKPTVFSTKKDLTAWYRGFGSSHNIVAHEETNMIYAVGTARNLSCAGGLWMVDVSDPANPTSPGCVNEDGYVHDGRLRDLRSWEHELTYSAQCVIYKGPDEKYIGQEICFNFNEDTLTIADVTDKKNPIQISKTPYVGASYTHQGWLVDENDHSYLLLDDELDEMDGTGSAANGHTTTYIFDIKDLSAPKHTGTYQSPVRSIDHNQYVVAGLSYQSNYGSGLRVVDVSSVFEDPTASSFKEVGSFDVHPEDDAVGGEVEFVGSWSVYPFFASGHILLNSIERGIYSLKYTGPAAEN
jgi:choice-of-anchor B domain-containing protein